MHNISTEDCTSVGDLVCNGLSVPEVSLSEQGFTVAVCLSIVDKLAHSLDG